ncbi:TlyA family RNA methyltransferase [Sedimentibacter sp.]|uniref:TlyA family RNA methyltransferase n=1 Tax=Sedimentibacter sp. TaxID=1960295 RepID=UPI0028A80B15|nr:TlyA family RNA methyltransferase [Sedimentibacter sp.]
MEPIRLDVYMHKNGLSQSRENAKQLILNECVYVNNKLINKPSVKVTDSDDIRIENSFEYVGRGAIKIEKAINLFDINVENKTAVDIGASTGGFTDFLLKKGADKVYAIDVGHNQLHGSLLDNNRVVNLEGTNFRYIEASVFKETIDIIVIDVSFISLRLLMPKICEITDDSTDIIALIKPQFEAGKENIGKNGIVKDKIIHLTVLNNIKKYCEDNNLFIKNITFSPITGGDGNIEYLAHIKKIKAVQNSSELNFKALIKIAFEFL